jgi:uncharacterized protein (TIGR02172 family)
MSGQDKQTESNMPKEKAMREISVEGCRVLGKGGNGAVYRLDDETIVKVYFSNRHSPERINLSRETTKNAFVHGIPTMIAFDMVKVGENYGVVYEMINAKSLGQEICEHPDKIDEYSNLIADTLLNIHHVEFEKGTLPDSKERLSKEVTATRDAGFYKPEEAARVMKLIDGIPDRNTFIHQDFHPGNLMLQNGEIMLIDVDDSGLGHPIIDLAAMHMVYVTAAKTSYKLTAMGLTKDQFARVWNNILKRYFHTDDENKIKEINRVIEGYAMISLIKGVATSPNVKNWIRKPVIAIYKKKFFKMIDTLYPIPEV